MYQKKHHGNKSAPGTVGAGVSASSTGGAGAPVAGSPVDAPPPPPPAAGAGVVVGPSRDPDSGVGAVVLVATGDLVVRGTAGAMVAGTGRTGMGAKVAPGASGDGVRSAMMMQGAWNALTPHCRPPSTMLL